VTTRVATIAADRRQRCLATTSLSSWSDHVFGPFVTPAARRYAKRLSLPPYLIEFLFLVEDKRFAFHLGLDPIAMLRSLIYNLRGRSLQGASTLVQQLYDIRRAREGHARVRTVARKMRQVLWAGREAAMRSRIVLLEEYLATVYWGRAHYGLDQACCGYFGVEPANLTIAQAFFLAERIAAPNRMSAARIAVLLNRPAIMTCLRSYGAASNEVVAIYERLYGLGEELWRSLERSTKP
jgi:membrane peptidoglycan carboxypeptidase